MPSNGYNEPESTSQSKSALWPTHVRCRQLHQHSCARVAGQEATPAQAKLGGFLDEGNAGVGHPRVRKPGRRGGAEYQAVITDPNFHPLTMQPQCGVL